MAFVTEGSCQPLCFLHVRYEDAARLRDEAHTSIEGWWAGRGEDDPYGHLLFVQQGFGCYKGAAYLPRNLMEIRVSCLV